VGTRGQEMRRLALASLLVCALCMPVLAAAEDLDPAAAYVQTMADLGVTASSPGSGADIAVGHGSAEPCPPGAPPPPFPGFCSTSPRDFHFAATSNLAADHARRCDDRLPDGRRRGHHGSRRPGDLQLDRNGAGPPSAHPLEARWLPLG
jgi:hypothetical protein